MSANGPLIDADDLRKKVSGTVAGSIPASRKWDSKLVIWATTRHGAVTGEISSSASSGTDPPDRAVSMADRSANRAPVVVAEVWIGAAPSGVLTHQASAVR